MAKVTGPLHSDDARGKLGNSIVFMGWKGIKTCRTWLKPANPQAPAQGDIRTIIAGLGRASGKVKVDKDYDTKLKDLGVIPAQQSKQSYLVQYIKDVHIAGKNTTMKENYLARHTSFSAHAAKTSFQGRAEGMGIADFSLDYDTIKTFDRGLGLYLLAKAAIALGFTGSPYTLAIASWTKAHVNALAVDMAG